MTLEDHAGDVVAKARSALGLTVVEAAALAGLAAGAYQDFERTAQGTAAPQLRRLPARLGLNADRLSALAAGWLPERRELTRWRELRQITTSAGMAVNAYLAWAPTTREAALFDTGWESEPVFAVMDQHELELTHIFITHGHHDHVAALAPIRQRFPEARVHSGPVDGPATRGNPGGVGIQTGGLQVTARPTPGHAADGTSYVIEGWSGNAPPVVVVGDALFAGSMGRAVGTEFERAKQAVRAQILSLPSDTLICPGHGPVTTVGEEKAHNPFFP